jgi:hypothetical protein
VELTKVMTSTPRKLNTAAINTAIFGLMERVETHVAIALGASVHPFTRITAIVKRVVITNNGLLLRFERYVLNSICIFLK